MFYLVPILGTLLSNVWLYLIVGILSYFYWITTRQYDFWSKQGIPGPRPLPIIGSYYNLTTAIPLHLSNCFEKYGKFFGIYRGKQPMLFICDPEVIKRIFTKDFHIFRNRGSVPPNNKIMSQTLLISTDEKWKRIRSIVSPTFTNSKLRKMEPLMSECSESLNAALDQIAATSGQFVAHDLMGNFTMDVIAKCAFATDTNANKDPDNVFIRNAKSIFNFSFGKIVAFLLIPQWVAKVLARFSKSPGIEFFLDISRHLIEQRKQKSLSSGVDDMLQLMINAEHNKLSDEGQEEGSGTKEDQFDAHHVNQGKEELEQEKQLLKNISGEKFLSEEEILAQLVVFFLAGYETTASTLSYCLYSLTTDQAVQHKLYQEISEAKLRDPKLGFDTVKQLPYLDAVLSETLRCYPPAMILNRQASQDYYIPECGVTIPKGNIISIPIAAMHWSPKHFENPKQFNPERFMPENVHKIIPYSYLPFGGGPRNCIGMRFALAEAKLALAQLIDRYQFYPVARTPTRLDPLLTVVLFRTHPIHIGIKKRVNR